ncbi:MAG TPA: ABC transporter ATP-binding protein [Pseudonocardiaceae bacterium]|jgi:ATP-binding cassette subfamily B protein|nr:ABC transporter ATP-binding protein [Pseudonocardiaceae bacterium]
MSLPDPPQHASLAALRRLAPYIRPVRGRLLGAGLAMLVAMLAGLAIPLLIQRIVDGPLAEADPAGLVLLSAGILALGVTEAGLIYLRRALVARPTTEVEARMRTDLYHHLQYLPMAFHDRWPSGQLLSRAVSDLTTIRRFLAFVSILLVVNVLTVLVGLVVLVVLAPQLGLLVVLMAVPMVALCRHHEQHYGRVARRAQDQVGDLTTTVEEAALGIRVLKSFGRGPRATRAFLAQARALRRTELTKVRLLAALWAVIIALPELTMAALLGVGGYAVAAGSLTLGTLVGTVTILAYLRWPLESLGWLLAETSNAAAATTRYWEVRDVRRTLADPPRPRALARPVRGALRLEGVRFHYPGAAGEVLRGVDLEVRPGETVALVGATGSGKTTLTALVPRLADVTSGRITVDDVDVRHLPLAELRSVVAAAFEDPVLFSASVRENVALGALASGDDAVRRALRVARAEQFVEALPWGLDTRIGEQGLTLSGGQRQRLALARAVFADPAVLVLDDPLSALDVHTEAEVEAALRQVLRDVTALVVAHRPSTVQLADRVALLADGRIAAVGTHSELLAEVPEYRRLLSPAVDGSPRTANPGVGGTRRATNPSAEEVVR